jgi:hypothetical protein
MNSEEGMRLWDDLLFIEVVVISALVFPLLVSPNPSSPGKQKDQMVLYMKWVAMDSSMPVF